MFATILGRLPRPPVDDDDAANLAVIRAQEAAGLEPLTDGRLATDGAPLERWRRAAALTTRAVKATLSGPYSLAVRSGGRAVERARELRTHVLALAKAGCPLIEIEESEGHRIGDDEDERAAYRDAHAALTEGISGSHLSLAIVGGNADTAGAETILSPAYASLAVDLVNGPDNWRLVTRAAATVGIVAGAMPARANGEEGPELMLWAARYAASTQGRGLARVGLAVAPGLEHETWDTAVRKMQAIGRAAQLATLPPGDDLADQLDPRSIDIRTAALGRRPTRKD